MRRLYWWMAAVLAVSSAAVGQIAPEEQARRLLEDGQLARSQGKVKQALDNFNTIVTGFPNTSWVDDALLEIGRYYVEVEGDVEKGRKAFEQVAQRFPQSDGAPGAYYYLGWLAMSRASTSAELDDAQAQFSRIQRLYPRSEWVPKALHAAGLVDRKAGRFLEAADVQRRVFLEYPTNESAPAAQLQVGDCLALLGEYRQAMEEYQRLRNRFPQSAPAAQALEHITALYRLYGAAAPAFALDNGYLPLAGPPGDLLKDLRAILWVAPRTLWVASNRLNSAAPFVDGKLAAGLVAQDPSSLALAPSGDLIVAAKAFVRVGPKDSRTFAVPDPKSNLPEPLTRIEAAAMLSDGSLLVSDLKQKAVLRFNPRSEYQGPFPDANPREIIRIVRDGEGGVALLDREAKSLKVFDEAGRLQRTIPTRGDNYEIRRPADLAVDFVRNIYLADEEQGVLVFSPKGSLTTMLKGPELRKPKAIALMPDGAVLVYDEKLQRILRYK